MSEPRPVVLVHGAWHGGWCWAALQAELDGLGVASYAPDLPGHGTSAEPLGDLHADVARIVSLLTRIDREVVLVGHSYGGAVVSGASAALTSGSAVLYVSAFALAVGESVNDVIRAHPPDDTALRDAFRPAGDDTTVLDPAAARDLLYGASPPGPSTAALARLEPQRMTSFTQASTAAPFGRVHSTYVLCTRDATVPVAQQDAMAARCDAVHSLDTDHSPFISAVSELAAVVAPVATGNQT